jgi:hypothetical protein
MPRSRTKRRARVAPPPSPQPARPARTTPAAAATPPANPGAIRRADVAHLGLMLAALALAYVLPFELLVLSYAVLGPAHYLTEISWLHDRKYFLPHRGLALLLSLTALGAMFMADPFWLGILVSACFALCAILANARTPALILGLLAAAAAVFAVLGLVGAPFAIAWALAPSVIHVSLFTLVFMTLGAFKSRSRAQFGLVGAYLLAIAAILILPPSQGTVIPALAKIGRDYFGDIGPALGAVFGVPHLVLDARITGLLSFLYTYHYLNWFIKADVIRWTAVPRPRLIAIAALSLAATGLYFYNYVYGFMVLLLLSLIHVLLEFPLNSLSIAQLGAAIGQSVRRPVGAAPAGPPGR